MPTAFGLAFAMMLLVLFFMAVGYSNNLIYIFVFFLSSVAFTSMLIANMNVQPLQLVKISAEKIFANEKSFVTAEFENTSERVLWSLQVYFSKALIADSSFRIEQKASNALAIPWLPLKRGQESLPRLTAQSIFPFSLLRAWKVFRPQQTVLIYPERKGDRAFPSEAGARVELHQIGLFRDHREFQSSDSPRRVDWRATARKGELLVKNYEEPQKGQMSFTWDQTSHLIFFEDRISQLCLWIDEAEREGFAYSLIIGKTQTPANHGGVHYHQCLQILALISEEEIHS